MNPRETYQKETGRPYEETYSGIQNIEGWDGDEELTWAEWGYVNWLEAQNAKLVEALKEILRRFEIGQCDFDGCADIADEALHQLKENDND